MGNDNGVGMNAFVPEFAAFRSSGEEEENENVFDGQFVWMGKPKTCGWAKTKLGKIADVGKKVKKKTKKFCNKTKVKVNGEKDVLGNVCEEACKEAMEAL